VATVHAPAALGRHVAGPRGGRSAPVRVARAVPRWRRLLTWLLLLTVAAGWFAFLRPSTLGGPMTLVLVSGQSMEPGMHTGDLAVVRAAPGYEVGDVVAFRVPQEQGGGPVVIHRIVDRDGDTLVLQGDNNSWVDPWPLTEADVVGVLVLHSPGAGEAVALVARPTNAAALVAALVAFLVLSAPDRGPAQQPSREAAA
jgi:signal peptidase I